MANMMDYIDWRGDISFKQSPFNEVDNIIMSQIGYVDLKGIVPDIGEKGCITLEKAAEKFFAQNDEEELKKIRTFIWQAPFVLKKAAKSERFRNIKLKCYRGVYDRKLQTQFAAFTADLGDGTAYISYMGTDDTLVGWKEDFNMSFLQPVPAQAEALSYLNTVGKYIRRKLRIGGHSKGGNLAIYSAIYASAGVQKKIVNIYNNDGPGFDKGVIESEEYGRMKPLMTSIVPYNSIVGMLLEHDDDYIVAASDEKGIMQHDAMSWQVKGTSIVEMEDLSVASKNMNEAVSNWINSVERGERKEFVDSLFEIISASGATTLSEIQTDRFTTAGAAIKMYATMPRRQKLMIRKILLSLTGEFDKVVKKKKIDKEAGGN
jgi:hypothetical protein